jgi:hypothetical protein
MPNIININHENIDLYLSSKSSNTNPSISIFDENELLEDMEDNNADNLSINSDSIDNRFKSTPINSQILNEENKLTQWVSCIKEIRSSNDLNAITFLNDILGPISFEDLNKYLINDHQIEVDNKNHLEITSFTDSLTQIIFKINERVFLDEINIYERLIENSFIIQIEVLHEKNLNLQSKDSDTDEWFIVWKNNLEESKNQLKIKHRIFTPKIKSFFFKTDTIRITLSGSLHLINAIGKGYFFISFHF